MKKYLSLFLVLVMLVTSMPMYAFAEGAQEGEEIAAVAETTEESAEEEPAEDTKEEEKKSEPEPEPEPVKEEPVEEKAEEEKASEEEPVQVASETGEETPAEETVTGEETPVEEPATEEETPAEEPATEEETPAEEPAAEEETPAEETVTGEETPTEEIPAGDETVTEGESAEETPAEGELETKEENNTAIIEGTPIDADGDGVIDGYDIDGDGVMDVDASGAAVLVEAPMAGELDSFDAALTPVSVFKMVSQTDSSVTLSWKKPAEVTGYKIQYSVNDASFEEPSDPIMLDADQTGCTVEGLKIGKRYYFRISALYDSTASEVTVLGGETPDGIDIVPFGPTTMEVETYSASAATLTWEPPVNEENVDGFSIEITTDDADIAGKTVVLKKEDIKKDDEGNFTYRHTNLVVGVTYSYVIKSYTEVDEEKVYSGRNTADEPATASYTAKLPAPENLKTQSASSTSVKLTWDAVDGATHYNIYRMLTTETGYTKIAEKIEVEDKDYPSYIDENVKLGYEYVYAVSASYVTGADEYVDEETGETITIPGVNYEGPRCGGVEGRSNPEAPATVSASVVSGTNDEIKITWSEVADVTGYILQGSDTGKEEDYVEIVLDPVKRTSYTEKNLEPGQKRYYRVKSYVILGGVQLESEWSAVAAAMTLPLAPKKVILTNHASYNQIKVAWEESEGADGYYVLRSASSKTTPVDEIADITDPDTLEYVDTDLTLNTTYYYRVQPYVIQTLNDGKEIRRAGGASATVSLKALPAAPSGLDGNQIDGTNTVELSWNPVDDVTGYYVYASRAGGAFAKIATVKGVTTGNVTTVIKDLVLNETYEFAVASYRKSGDKTYTGPMCDEEEYLKIEMAYYAPTNLEADPQSKSKVKLTWDEVGGITGYELRVYESGKTVDDAFYTKRLTSTNITLSSLDCNKDYVANLRVYRKIDGKYESGPEEEIEFYTAPAKPSTVTLKLDADATGVTVSWGKVSEAEAYSVLRGFEKDGSDAVELTSQAYVTGSKFVDSDITPGEKYYYHVKSIVVPDCSTHDTHESSVASASILHLPGKVQNLEVTGNGAEEVILTWDPVEGADGYYIYQKKGSGKYARRSDVYVGDDVDEEGNAVMTCIVDGLKGGTKYTYQVRAYVDTADGSKAYGAYSTAVSITPAPLPPQEIRIEQINAKSVKLSWDNPGGATSYKIYYQLSDGTKKYISTVSSTKDEVEATVKKLDYDTEYTFFVKSGANKAYSDQYSPASPAVTTALGMVEGFDFSHVNSTQLKLVWDKLTDTSGYQIQKKVDGAWKLIKTAASDAKSYTVNSLTLGDTYDFRIRGYVKGYEQEADEGWVELLNAFTKPSKPGDFKVSSWGQNYIRIRWSAVKNATGYIVYWREKGSGDEWQSEAINEVPASGTIYYDIDGLDSYTNYEFYVRAYVFEPDSDYCGTKTSTLTRRTSK